VLRIGSRWRRAENKFAPTRRLSRLVVRLSSPSFIFGLTAAGLYRAAAFLRNE
jgi:hypothetical protein